MCRLALSACAFLIGALTLSLAHAEPPKPCQGSDLTQVEGLAAAEAARADDLVNGDGLLWRIEKPGLAPSYSLRHHSFDRRVCARSGASRRAIDQRLQGRGDGTWRAYRHFIEKANITAATLAKALDRDHDTFEGAIAPEDREKIEKLDHEPRLSRRIRAPLEALVSGHPDRAPQMRSGARRRSICPRSTSFSPRRQETRG